MDPEQFLALVSRLISAQSRRDALAGAVGGALASIGITTIAESRRGKNQKASGRKKKKYQAGDRNPGADHDEGPRQRHKNRKHDRKRGHGASKSNKKAHTEKKKKRDRCKTNGEHCARNGKCCSGHCNPDTHTCTRKPVS
jgi:hypothetical protein